MGGNLSIISCCSLYSKLLVPILSFFMKQTKIEWKVHSIQYFSIKFWSHFKIGRTNVSFSISWVIASNYDSGQIMKNYISCTCVLKKYIQPWLVWLSGLSTNLRTKGHWFDSQSGPMPGLQTRSPVGGTWEATTHWCFSPTLSLFLPLFLKINK